MKAIVRCLLILKLALTSPPPLSLREGVGTGLDEKME